MIPGLTIRSDFLTEFQESALKLNIVLSAEKKEGEKRNSIQRYGSNVPYTGKVISTEIPEYLQVLARWIYTEGIIDFIPDSITINEYKQGQGIDYHIDTYQSGPVVLILALCGGATLLMRKDGVVQEYPFPARALLKLEGEARKKWQHAIAPVTEDRISIVFRKARKT